MLRINVKSLAQDLTLSIKNTSIASLLVKASGMLLPERAAKESMFQDLVHIGFLSMLLTFQSTSCRTLIKSSNGYEARFDSIIKKLY